MIDPEDVGEGEAGIGRRESRSDIEAPDTIGTGSALAVGCVAVAILLVLVALVVRWVAGGW